MEKDRDWARRPASYLTGQMPTGLACSTAIIATDSCGPNCRGGQIPVECCNHNHNPERRSHKTGARNRSQLWLFPFLLSVLRPLEIQRPFFLLVSHRIARITITKNRMKVGSIALFLASKMPSATKPRTINPIFASWFIAVSGEKPESNKTPR